MLHPLWIHCVLLPLIRPPTTTTYLHIYIVDNNISRLQARHLSTQCVSLLELCPSRLSQLIYSIEWFVSSTAAAAATQQPLPSPCRTLCHKSFRIREAFVSGHVPYPTHLHYHSVRRRWHGMVLDWRFRVSASISS